MYCTDVFFYEIAQTKRDEKQKLTYDSAKFYCDVGTLRTHAQTKQTF